MVRKNVRIVFQNKTDPQRRRKQAEKFARIVLLHRKTQGSGGMSVEECDRIANEIGVSSRTVWRDMATLTLAYEMIGSHLLDNQTPKEVVP